MARYGLFLILYRIVRNKKYRLPYVILPRVSTTGGNTTVGWPTTTRFSQKSPLPTWESRGIKVEFAHSIFCRVCQIIEIYFDKTERSGQKTIFSFVNDS